jgi:hypothetical protein
MTGPSLAPLIIPIAGTLFLTAWLTPPAASRGEPPAIQRPATKVRARPGHSARETGAMTIDYLAVESSGDAGRPRVHA